VCLSRIMTWIFNVICRVFSSFFLFSKLKWEVIVGFVDIGGNLCQLILYYVFTIYLFTYYINVFVRHPLKVIVHKLTFSKRQHLGLRIKQVCRSQQTESDRIADHDRQNQTGLQITTGRSNDNIYTTRYWFS
jgi:hypothetical protein